MRTSQSPGRKFYSAKGRLLVAPKHKFKKMDKFGPKVLIWQAICSCGRKTKPFVTKKNMDSVLYEKECIRRRLLPLYRQHTSPVIFWLDLASCHYSKKMLECYEKEEIRYVPKEYNPPNCPEVRPIEKYWAIMKRKMSKNDGLVKSMRGKSRMWTRCCQEMTLENVRTLMGSITAKVRDMVRAGEY